MYSELGSSYCLRNGQRHATDRRVPGNISRVILPCDQVADPQIIVGVDKI